MRTKFQGKHKLASRWVGADCGRVLDVGCATGIFSNHLLSRSKAVYAIDISKDSIKIARKNYPNVKFKQASIEKTPYPNEFFDTVVALDVIEHCQNDKKAITEIRRILKKRGRLIIAVPYKGPLEKLHLENLNFHFPNLAKLSMMVVYKLSRASQFKYKSWDKMYQANLGNHPYHRQYNASEICSLLGSQFKVIRSRGAGGPLIVLGRIMDIPFLVSGKLKFLRRMISLLNYDYLIDYGPLSYSLFLKVKKLKN